MNTAHEEKTFKCQKLRTVHNSLGENNKIILRDGQEPLDNEEFCNLFWGKRSPSHKNVHPPSNSYLNARRVVVNVLRDFV